MKMLRPKGVIIVIPSFEHAYECDVECIEHAEAMKPSQPTWRKW